LFRALGTTPLTLIVVRVFHHSTATSLLLTSSNSVSTTVTTQEPLNEPPPRIVSSWLRLSDPVSITPGTFHSGSWTPAASLLNNSTILRHCSGYSHIRFDMEVEVLFTPSAYHSGVFVVCWQPMCLASAGYADTIPSATDLTHRRIQASQKYGTMINLRDDHTAKLTIPFFYHTERMPLAASSNAGGYGVLQVEALTKLGDVGANRNLTYSVRARLINVELSGKSVILQSSTITQLADIVGDTTSTLSAVGQIASLAMGDPATSAAAAAMGQVGSNVASAMRDVAHLAEEFGFCNDISTAPPTYIYPTLMPALWSADISCPIPFFGIAPRSSMATVADDEDSDDLLNIKSLCSRPSYITTIETTLPIATGNIIFDAFVAPGYTRYVALTGTAGLTYTGLVDTPARYVANMFQGWRGTVCFKFILSSTQFTKGSVRINYSNNGQVTTFPAALDTLVAPIEWDFSKSSSIVVKIPMSSSSDYLRCVPSWSDGVAVANAFLPNRQHTYSAYELSSLPAIPATYDSAFFNGALSLQVGNTFCNGTDDDVISIAVVTWLEEAEFTGTSISDPTVGVSLSSPYDLHSETQEVMVDLIPDAPPMRQPIYLSEKVESLRPLLLKANLADVYIPDSSNAITDASAISVEYLTHAVPPGHGWTHPITVGYRSINAASVKDKINGTGAGSNTLYFYQPNLPFHWIVAMFAGWRGSVNWRFMAYNSQRSGPTFSFLGPERLLATTVSEIPGDTAFSNVGSLLELTSSDTWPLQFYANTAFQRKGAAGLDVTNLSTSKTTSCSIPYPSLDRFLPTSTTYLKRPDVYALGYPTFKGRSRLFNNYLRLNLLYKYNTSDAVSRALPLTSAAVEAYFSTGTDFNCVHFISTPVVYVNRIVSGFAQIPTPLTA